MSSRATLATCVYVHYISVRVGEYLLYILSALQILPQIQKWNYTIIVVGP